MSDIELIENDIILLVIELAGLGKISMMDPEYNRIYKEIVEDLHKLRNFDQYYSYDQDKVSNMYFCYYDFDGNYHECYFDDGEKVDDLPF